MAVPKLIPTNYSSDGPRMREHNKSTRSFWFFWSGTSLGYHGQNKLIGLRRDIVISASSDEESHLGFIWRNYGGQGGGAFPRQIVDKSGKVTIRRKKRKREREKWEKNFTRCSNSFNNLLVINGHAYLRFAPGEPFPLMISPPSIFWTTLCNIKSCYVWEPFPLQTIVCII